MRNASFPDPESDRKRSRLMTGLAAFCVMSLVALIELRGLWNDTEPSIDAGRQAESNGPIIQPVDSMFARQRASEPTYPLPGFIAEQLPDGQYSRVRSQLITRAAAAVHSDDRGALAHAVALLGAAALSENDLASARVYLDEALDVYEQEGDDIGIASVELLRSRVESVARENARDAASAQEVMHIAAWMINKQRFWEAEDSLISAIRENQRLNRFGATAAGYEMLERGYRSIGQYDAADEAAAQAARLHAASGRRIRAEAIATRLESQGHALATLQTLRADITRASSEFDASNRELHRARDYEHLYRRLLAAGDPVQAWTFRQKANDSLAKASKRAMYQRQTGVIALLYNSNDNREAARESLERAREIFAREQDQDVLNHIQRAEAQIW